MIDYFIHFINKHFHLFRVDNAPTVKHRSDFMDKLRNIFGIHSVFRAILSKERLSSAASLIST